MQKLNNFNWKNFFLQGVLPFALAFTAAFFARYQLELSDGVTPDFLAMQWPLYAPLHALTAFCLTLVLFAILGKWSRATGISGALFTVIALINYYTRDLHGSALMPQDILNLGTAAEVMGSYTLHITQTVIKTTFRMTYSDVNDIIAGDQEKAKQFKAIVPSIDSMVRLHEILENMRFKRGALNFDTNEAKIMVNKEGRPVDIVLRQRGIAERMIESFMLIANETVAEHFTRLKLPFIYRIHEDPKAEKVQKFIDYASSFGIQIYGTASEMSQEALQEIMRKVEGEPYADVLSMMLLRSMQQARYSEHNHGHYGLAAEYYTHFTSPIRRYPDLMVHRMVREYGKSQEVAEHFEQVLPDIASQSSSRERRAIDAEREVEAMKKAEYMEDFVGEEYDAVVSSVVKFGLFVELPNTVEGLIHITNLPEFYHFNERDLTLRGEKSGVTYRVGQQIRLKVERADKMTGEIDFSYIPSEWDVVEKGLKAKGRDRDGNRRDRRRKDKKVSKGSTARKDDKRKDSSSKSKKKKRKKPFYKEVAKKGAKHGKGRRKGSRTK